MIWEDLGIIGFRSKTTTSDCRIPLVGVTGVLKIRKALHSGERGPLQSPPCGGVHLHPFKMATGIFTFIINMLNLPVLSPACLEYLIIPQNHTGMERYAD